MRNQSRRYAPEWLERKLSPSSLIATPVAAEVQVTASVTSNDDPPPPYDPTLPPGPGNLPPPPAPGNPTGPSGPAS
jgi:hypothetical protein